jgi:hypothetical protein
LTATGLAATGFTELVLVIFVSVAVMLKFL